VRSIAGWPGSRCISPSGARARRRRRGSPARARRSLGPRGGWSWPTARTAPPVSFLRSGCWRPAAPRPWHHRSKARGRGRGRGPRGRARRCCRVPSLHRAVSTAAAVEAIRRARRPPARRWPPRSVRTTCCSTRAATRAAMPADFRHEPAAAAAAELPALVERPRRTARSTSCPTDSLPVPAAGHRDMRISQQCPMGWRGRAPSGPPVDPRCACRPHRPKPLRGARATAPPARIFAWLRPRIRSIPGRRRSRRLEPRRWSGRSGPPCRGPRCDTSVYEACRVRGRAETVLSARARCRRGRRTGGTAGRRPLRARSPRAADLGAAPGLTPPPGHRYIGQ